MKLLSRMLTAAVLIALAVTLSVRLTHTPLTALPVAPEPSVAPLPLAIAAPTVIEVPIESQISPVAKPKPKSHPAGPPRRRGLFRRR